MPMALRDVPAVVHVVCDTLLPIETSDRSRVVLAMQGLSRGIVSPSPFAICVLANHVRRVVAGYARERCQVGRASGAP
jgi:hypothetical protein